MGLLDNYKSPEDQQAAGSLLDSYTGDAATVEAAAPAAPYQSPGEATENGWLENTKARFTDPERYKAILGMESPAKTTAVTGAPPMAMPAAQAPAMLSKLAHFFNASAPRRAVAGAAQGAATDRENPLRGGAIGGLSSLLGDGLAKLLKAPGDVAMQAAVGRRRYTPGVGTTLADEGIIGTREGMTKQVGRKLGERAEDMHALAAEIPGVPIDSPQMGRDIAQSAAKPLAVPGGAPSSADIPKIQKIREFGEDIVSRGMETGPQGLARRIAAGQRSYRGKEDPLQSLLGQLSKQEQIQYSGALKGAHEAATGTKAFADTDKAYGALKRAQAGLSEEPRIPRSLFGLATVPATHIPGGAALTSTLGQALTKGGQTVDFLNNPILRQILLEKAK
jgi:hypothetical protein